MVSRESDRYRIYAYFYKNAITAILTIDNERGLSYILITVIELQRFVEMDVQLKYIAEVSSGVTFRSRIEPSAEGAVRVIQMKDLGDDNLVHLDECIQIEHSPPKPNQLSKSGDLIFRSRGQTNTAAIIQGDATGTILAAPLLRVRADVEKVLPEFLLWWINQASSQSYLSTRSKGTTVKMVGKPALEEMPVSLPSMEDQKRIAAFFDLSRQEQNLLDEIKKQKAIYTQGILMRMASESRETASNKKPGFDVAASLPGRTHQT